MRIAMIIGAAIVCAGCSSAASLPQPEGPFEPLNGWDPNSPAVTQPISLTSPVANEQAKAIRRAQAEIKGIQ